MRPGPTAELFVVALDHRRAFVEAVLGDAEAPIGDAERARIEDAKRIVFDGALCALGQRDDARGFGVLVDERFGEQIARRAKQAQLTLLMPVEDPTSERFAFEYGDQFGAHVERFDPHLTKALVRCNPERDDGALRTQAPDLRRLCTWLHARDRHLLLELLVPAEDHQLARVGGDVRRFERELRPDLIARSIGMLQELGVEPDVWKVEGLDTGADCRTVAAAARADGREHVSCVLLGSGADADRVGHWLAQAATVDGFVGFTIGRSIWADPLDRCLRAHIDRDEAVERIAATYLGFVATYEAAADGRR